MTFKHFNMASMRKAPQYVCKIVTVLLLFVLAVASAFADGSEKFEVGRYQIFSGTIQSLTQTGKSIDSEKYPLVIKLDTKTGDTWIYISHATKDGYKEGWMSISGIETLRSR